MSDCGHEEIILQLQEENRELKLTIEKTRELKLTIENLTISNKDLQKRLAYYENAHSQPSRNSLEWKKQKKERKQPNKSGRGGITGHKGATQRFAPTTSPIHHKSETCQKCGSAELSQIKTRKRVMVTIPPPVPYGTTEHVLYRYTVRIVLMISKLLRETFQRMEVLIPLQYVRWYHCSQREYHMTQQITLEERYGLEINCTAVQSILRTGGMMLEPLYSNIHSKIVTEKILGLDETTFPIDGRTGWMPGCKK